MENSLPSNEDLIAFSTAVPWQVIETKRRQFKQCLEDLAENSTLTPDQLPLEAISDAVEAPVFTHTDPHNTELGNVLLTEYGGRTIVLGSFVGSRYRGDYPLIKSIVPYNLNPSVNHTNLPETDDPTTRMRLLGAEIEMGLVHRDGTSPNEEEMQRYMQIYSKHAQRIGIYPFLDREACQYQIEAHIAPSLGYTQTRQALNGIFAALAATSAETGLVTAILSAYPTKSDFLMTDHPKVTTAVDLMLEVNDLFPEYRQRLADAKKRYHVGDSAHYVNMFRNQGCHIHIDIAGRSEALGLLVFYTLLRSASAMANSAILKGGPFVNGTCDPEFVCTRDYLRNTTVTGRYLNLPLSPHFAPNGVGHYAELLRLERANAVGRAMLYDSSLDQPVSVMHNPIGRLRADLSSSKRVCTVESTGMSTNVSSARMSGVLTDFEFSHTVIEAYFREHGLDLQPMREDSTMWEIFGPLSQVTFEKLQDNADRNGSNILITTAAGTEMPLVDFYNMKRQFMHKALADVMEITPRDLDDVYTSLERMLRPPSGMEAQTIEDYINNPKLRSTGNWGEILRNAFLQAGGTLGEHNPDAVQTVVNQVHDAMSKRYLPS